MKIATVVSPENVHVGSTVGAMNLCSYSDTFVPFSSTVLGGKPGFVEIGVGEDLEMVYPQHSIVDGLEAFDPDGVLIFTLNTEIYESLDEGIVDKFPTAWRCNANFLELFIRPDTRDALPHIIGMPTKADAVVCATEEVKKDLSALGWDNSTVIPSAINVSGFEESEADGDIIVSMTRMSSVKNLVTSMLAMRSVIRSNPSAEYRIFGKGELEDYVEKLIKMFGSDRISYEGYEDNDKVLQEAKILLQLSLSENQSLSPLEAMASGIPCVVSDISGHPYSQVRVPHDSVHGTKEAVERLLDDDDFYERKRRQGLMEVSDHSVEAVVPEYEDLFGRLMGLREDFKE